VFFVLGLVYAPESLFASNSYIIEKFDIFSTMAAELFFMLKVRQFQIQWLHRKRAAGQESTTHPWFDDGQIPRSQRKPTLPLDEFVEPVKKSHL
jgi:hypothetical protein